MPESTAVRRLRSARSMAAFHTAPTRPFRCDHHGSACRGQRHATQCDVLGPATCPHAANAGSLGTNGSSGSGRRNDART